MDSSRFYLFAVFLSPQGWRQSWSSALMEDVGDASGKLEQKKLVLFQNMQNMQNLQNIQNMQKKYAKFHLKLAGLDVAKDGGAIAACLTNTANINSIQLF